MLSQRYLQKVMKEDIIIAESEHLVLQNQIKALKINMNNKLNIIIIAVNNRSALNTTIDLQAVKLILNSQNTQKPEHLRFIR